MINNVTIEGWANYMDLRTISSGTHVLGFSLSTSGGKNKGYNYIKCVVWSDLADEMNDRLENRDKVRLTGYLNNNNWEDKFGQKRRDVELVVTGYSKEEKSTKGGDDDIPF